jgi:hypothetical protein
MERGPILLLENDSRRSGQANQEGPRRGQTDDPGPDHENVAIRAA